MKPEIALRSIKLLHTAVWTGFVACIVAIPIFTYLDQFGWAAFFIGVVFLEVLVLIFNRMRCPLTNVAASFTDDRRDNFDIFLPEWIARHNKFIFGGLYLAGAFYTLARWAGWLG